MPTGTNKSPLTLDPATAMALAKYRVGEFKSSQQAAKDIAAAEREAGTGKIQTIARGVLGGELERADYGLSKLGLETNLSDFALSKKAKEFEKQKDYVPEYTTNIDPMTGEEINSPLTMSSKPLKALTSIEGTIPYNKSAKQHESALKMNKIAMSGISSKY